jgi:carboxypeptidase Taq
MTKEQDDYNNLHNISRTTRTLEGISSILDWDHETYMPSGAAGIRSEQFKAMAGIIHQKKTSRPFVNALNKLIDIKTGKIKAKNLLDAQKAALGEWRRDYIHAKALPKRFVEDFAQLTSQAIGVWRNARSQDAFNQFAPFLEKIVSMCRKKADYLGYQEHPYDALLDLYEPGLTTKEVKPLFGNLRKATAPLLKKILSAKSGDDSFLFGDFAQDKQLKFGHTLLDAMGYDLTKGRLDLSTHPFSSASHPTDSRITTRIHPTSLMSNIFAVIHETGHALYEMGLPSEQYGTPLGDARSLGIHESQSRIWETLIGHSKPFWKHFFPLLQKQFKGQLDHVSLDAFYKAINKVQPSLIRIEADEVSYPLHVTLRFELEIEMIEGTLNVRDLPEAWNAKMQELLQVTPSTNKEGCLQDIHWSMGAFGYFPTYALGTMYAAHLFSSFTKTHSDWDKRVAKGELGFIKEWLNQAIYQHGRRYSSKELLEKATGKPFSADAFISYLKEKYK